MTDKDNGKPKLEWSHGKMRVTLRRPSDGGPPAMPPTVETAPFRDPKTGKFLPGNGAARGRQLRASAKGIATLDPKRCAQWVRPFVEEGAAYGVALLQRFPDPALARLVGDTADAHTVYRALLHLATHDGDTNALKEARAWLLQHRSCLAALSSLAGEGNEAGAGTDESDFTVPAGGE